MGKKSLIGIFLLSSFLLSGCSVLLEKEYSSVQPHAAQAWEQGDKTELTANSAEDLEKALLTMIDRYSTEEEIHMGEEIPKASAETWMREAMEKVQNENGVGAYATEYIVYTIEAEDNNVKVHAFIGYKKTEEEVRSIYYATTLDALPDLLDEAIREEKTSLVLHVTTLPEEFEQTVGKYLSESLTPVEGKNIEVEQVYEVNYYPTAGNPSVIEIILLG